LPKSINNLAHRFSASPKWLSILKLDFYPKSTVYTRLKNVNSFSTTELPCTAKEIKLYAGLNQEGSLMATGSHYAFSGKSRSMRNKESKGSGFYIGHGSVILFSIFLLLVFPFAAAADFFHRLVYSAAISLALTSTTVIAVVSFLRSKKKERPSRAVYVQQTAKSPKTETETETQKFKPQPSGLWTQDNLKNMSWDQFSRLCMLFLRTRGVSVRQTKEKENHLADLELMQNGKVCGLVLCNNQRESQAKLKDLQNFQRLLNTRSYEQGVFFNLAGFSDADIKWAAKQNIRCVTGAFLLAALNQTEAFQSRDSLAIFE